MIPLSAKLAASSRRQARMAVLGKLPANRLIHFGAIVLMSTIIACYIIAVAEGHVKPWLPTISACGEHPPEEYVFRYGIHTGALLLVVLALYMYTADFPFSHDTLNVGMGVVAGLFLGVVAICAANEDDMLHTTSAVIFFVLEDVLLFRITLQSQGSLSRLSFSIKSVCTVLAWLFSIGRLLYMLDYLPGEVHIGSWLDVPVLPLLEWSDTFAIFAFYWSFALDFTPNYFLAAWKSEESTGTPEKIKLYN